MNDFFAALTGFLATYSVEISTAATAVFTGLLAWITWSQSRRRIVDEWDFNSPWSNRIVVQVTIRNGQDYAIKPGRVRVGPRFVKDVQPNSQHKKHQNWPANECAVEMNVPYIAPGQSASFTFVVYPDWEAVHRQQQRWRAGIRRWFAMVAWKSLSARVHHGASVHFQITIASKLAKSRLIRIKAKMRIPLQAAEKQVAAIKAKESPS